MVQESLPLADDNRLVDEREFLMEVSKVYDDRGFDTKLVWYVYSTIKPFFIGSSCLELGPADGEMSNLLKDDFASLSVVDISVDFVRNAERLGSNIKGYVNLFEEFEPPEAYDVVVMSHVLEHVQRPIELLQHSASWLRPNGRIIAVVPNADSLHRQLGVKLGMLERTNSMNEQDVKLGHRRVYDRAELDDDIRAAGLRVVAKGGIFLKLLSNAQMMMFEDELLDGMFELGKDLPQLSSQLYAVCVPR